MMRGMIRNQTPFYYSQYVEKTELEDEYGNKTGEYRLVYAEPVKSFGNISAAQGEMQTRQFGESETYDKVIVIDDPNTPINEYSILWVDAVPNLSENSEYKIPHDYEVRKVARSLNSVSIAISKVNVSD